MSSREMDAARPAADALAALLRRWPIACALGREVAVTETTLSLTTPAVLVVNGGSVWISRGTAPAQRLDAGDVWIDHDAASLRVSSSPPENELLATSGSWSPSVDPLVLPSLVVIDLISVSPQVNQRLLPAPFLTSPKGGTTVDHLAPLLDSLITTARAAAVPPVGDALATAVYLECLHRHLLTRPKDVSWLTGLFDGEIGPIVAALLEAPARDWTVESLAEVGGMSRSAFARKFRDLMGTAPIDFLVEVRMWQAARQLKLQSLDLKTISREAGYQSPAAFSVAFKRWSGETPSDYRRAT